MGDSEAALEKDDPPATVHPSAYVPGRRASVEPYTKVKPLQSTISEAAPRLDQDTSSSKTPRPGASPPGASRGPYGEQKDCSGTNNGSSSHQRSESSQNDTSVRSFSDGPKDSSIPSNLQIDEHPAVDRVEDSKGNSEREEQFLSTTSDKNSRNGPVIPVGGVSEWSHQVIAPNDVQEDEEKEDDGWQDMPAYGKFDLYDDDGNLIARGANDADLAADGYEGLGGAGKGYTRIQVDDDAQSATSMDENTSYLFKDSGTNVVDDDEEHRDPLAQMKATKLMLTEGQRIAYVGVTRLAMVQMVKDLENVQAARNNRKEVVSPIESMKMWGQKMMVRLYTHMDIDPSGIIDQLIHINILILNRANHDRTTSGAWRPASRLDPRPHAKLSC